MFQLNPPNIIGFAALTLDLLLMVKILFQPADDRVAKYLLLGLLAGFAAIIANQLYALTRLYLTFPHYSGTTVFLLYTIGPLLYAYIRRLALGATPWEMPFWYLHWILPVGLTLSLIPFYGLSAEEKLLLFQTEEARLLRSGIILGNYLQILIYVYLCQKPLQTYQQHILDNFSDIGKINLSWLKKICYGWVFLVLLDVVLPLSGAVPTILYQIFITANALFIVIIAYSALGHSQLQFPSFAENEIDRVNTYQNVSTEKYTRSGLRDDTAQYCLNKLQQLMETEQSFLDDSLSLSTLAQKVNVSPHHLSQLLNEQLQSNFYDYVNGLRIEYAKRLLRDNAERPVVEIAYESGYTNKATFYGAFKRLVGKTPLQFRNQLSEMTAAEQGDEVDIKS